MRLIVAALFVAVSTAGCLDDLFGTDRGSPYDYIRPDHSKWIIEVDATPGWEPSSNLLSTLRLRMDEVVRKEQIITQLDDQLPSQSRWTRGDIDDLHDRFGDRKTSGDTAATHLMFLDGRYEQENVLGIAIGHDLVVIFSERIRETCQSNQLGLPAACTAADENRGREAVLVHEFGHIIGLVNNGIPMVNNHEAETCETRNGPVPGDGHSRNENSVMFCNVDTMGLFGLNQIPTTFDSNDKLDICAAGGKGTC